MTLNKDDKTPLLAEEGGIRQRTRKHSDENKEHKSQKYKDWDPDLPYGGKVYLARRRKPDPLWIRVTEVTLGGGDRILFLFQKRNAMASKTLPNAIPMDSPAPRARKQKGGNIEKM